VKRLLAFIIVTSPANAYEVETHGLLTLEAYKVSVLQPLPSPNPLYVRLGFDRQDAQDVSLRQAAFWRNPYPMLKPIDPHRCLEGIDGAASAVGFGGVVHADFGGVGERLERCGVLPVAGVVVRHVHGVAGPVKS
jgi:hypothetical protein